MKLIIAIADNMPEDAKLVLVTGSGKLGKCWHTETELDPGHLEKLSLREVSERYLIPLLAAAKKQRECSSKNITST